MGAQQDRFDGGTQLDRAPRRQAAWQEAGAAQAAGPAHRRRTKHGVTVLTKRLEVRAKQVIVAIPPTLAGRIDYRPDLPPERDQLTQRIPQGNLTKVACVYDRPFWRDAGLNGTAVSTDGFVNATFDDTPPGGSPGVVFGFVGGDQSRQFNALLGAASARRRSSRQFTQFFGAGAANPIDYIESYWAGERWSRGCPVGIAGPGVYTGYGPGAAPAGRQNPLGRDRDLHLLEWLHGRRGPLRRARGGGGARRLEPTRGAARLLPWPEVIRRQGRRLLRSRQDPDGGVVRDGLRAGGQPAGLRPPPPARQVGRDHLRYRLRGSSDEQTNAVLEVAKRIFAEIPERDVERMAPEVLAGILPRIYPQMLDEVHRHQDEGRATFIVSAAGQRPGQDAGGGARHGGWDRHPLGGRLRRQVHGGDGWPLRLRRGQGRGDAAFADEHDIDLADS